MNRFIIWGFAALAVAVVFAFGYFVMVNANQSGQQLKSAQKLVFDWFETSTGFAADSKKRAERNFAQWRQEKEFELSNLKQQKAQLELEWQIINQRSDDAEVKAINEAKYHKYLAKVDADIKNVLQKIEDWNFEKWQECKQAVILMISAAIAFVFLFVAFFVEHKSTKAAKYINAAGLICPPIYGTACMLQLGIVAGIWMLVVFVIFIELILYAAFVLEKTCDI